MLISMLVERGVGKHREAPCPPGSWLLALLALLAPGPPGPPGLPTLPLSAPCNLVQV